MQWEQEKAELKIEVEQLQLESGETLNNIMVRMSLVCPTMVWLSVAWQLECKRPLHVHVSSHTSS